MVGNRDDEHHVSPDGARAHEHAGHASVSADTSPAHLI